jgi:ferredoxin-fold anticodon binding domain-containing protein
MNRKLKPIDFNGKLLDKSEQWLEDHAQAVFYNLIECLEWFVDGDVSQLYTMIEERVSLDDWYVEMSHRIENYNDTYYILEEEDLMKFRGILK